MFGMSKTNSEKLKKKRTYINNFRKEKFIVEGGRKENDELYCH